MLQSNPEVKAVVGRWVNAVGTADWETAQNLFSRDAGLRYVGTDTAEWWSGPDVATVFGAHMAEAPEFHIEFDPDSDVEGFSEGSVGWGALIGRVRFGDMDEVIIRHTSVLVLDAGFWRIVQVHNSIGSPNVEVIGVDLTATLGELLQSMGDEAERGFRERFDEGTVTLMFTDIENSTDLAIRLGDDQWKNIIGWHDETIASIVASHGGTVVKTLGDGAMLAFESTRMAARAAIAIQRSISAPDAPTAFRVRIGVHIGDVVHTGEDLLGNAVNKAARIASSADGGQIVTSRVVHAMLAESPEFHFGEVHEVELKGIEGLHEVRILDWAD